MAKVPARKFTKPALDIPAQIALLQQRGLVINNTIHAQQSLRHIGYYRLSGCMLPFQIPGGAHQFVAGTSFEQITDLYSFDRKLRIIFLDALDRIEVGFRAATTQAMCTRHGATWYLDPKNFLARTDHGALIQSIKDEIGHDNPKKRAVHIQHYYDNYDDPAMPPSWMIFEAVSFGSLAFILRNLTSHNSKAVARLMGLPEPALRSWSLSLSYLRNLCAHHERIWNRIYTIKPTIVGPYAAELQPNDKTYAQAVVLRTMLRLTSGASMWRNRLVQLFEDHPDVPIDKMGFPANWQTHAFWI